ncbi:Pectin lyase-like superfamily protein [Quillaja saponaria]|uniref:Pectin lyase-like superfamily protein n=1 Tax=Quillaja saponaria TaxID=32244 RepID=A0AAD7L349_QUISA|nr:Pectin lyase-like superfamily protein [Quillaja saponaria]
MGFMNCCSTRVLFITFFLVCAIEAQSQTKVFNVIDYGAAANGQSDNSGAFFQAWKEACRWKGNTRVYIPAGTYFLRPVTFIGPCYGFMEFMIIGILKAPSDSAAIFTDKWINFQYVSNLTVAGGGVLDGQGAAAWQQSQCNKKTDCQTFPISLRFDFVTDSRVQSIQSINSKKNHIMLYGCERMNLTDITILAPGDSPNTDGIKIGKSQHIRITNATISTGDDCVAIISGSKDVYISNVFCGPGHGISVGSLGKYRDEDDVLGINVKNCIFNGTTNGLRLKTWASPYATKASDFTFQDIIMNNVENPIIIDQNYCPHPPCTLQVFLPSPPFIF